MSKTLLVTGGSRGIGHAVAVQAGGLGWSVAINYREDRDAAETTLGKVRSAGGRGIIVQGDVSVEADVMRMFATTAEAFSAIDGVVVNAGIVAPASKLADMSVDRIRRTLDVNVLGGYLCAREAARYLSRSRGGRGGSIVIVSSAASRLGSANEYVDYAGAKGAMDSLTLGLAKELGPDGVRVNAVRPAFIDTQIHASSGRADRAHVLGAQTPLGRAGTADEVAEAIIWLAGDASSYVTGSLIDMAGGR